MEKGIERIEKREENNMGKVNGFIEIERKVEK